MPRQVGQGRARAESLVCKDKTGQDNQGQHRQGQGNCLNCTGQGQGKAGQSRPGQDMGGQGRADCKSANSSGLPDGFSI